MSADFTFVTTLMCCLATALACNSDEDCNLNGICDQAATFCKCDDWWTGTSCSMLNFAPASQHFAYKQGSGANGSSWGASVAQDDEGTFHLFATEWANDCGIAYWTPNSRIVRATSSSVIGPYQIVEEVLPTFWSNPQLVQAVDKTWLLFVIGMFCNDTVDCRNKSAPLPKRPPSCSGSSHKHMENGISLFSSKSLTGPWTSHGLILNGSSRQRYPNGSNPAPWDYDTTNPSPLVLANGTVLLIYRGCEDGCKGKEMIGVASAPHWTGPYARIHEHAQPQMAQQAQEDPFVFQDPRGNFHMLTHTMQKGDSIGLHAWSRDGFDWTMGKPDAAYTKTVQWSDGPNTTFAQRERPFLLFDGNRPTHLINGVRNLSSSKGEYGSGSFPNYPTHTIMIPLTGHKSEDHYVVL